MNRSEAVTDVIHHEPRHTSIEDRRQLGRHRDDDAAAKTPSVSELKVTSA